MTKTITFRNSAVRKTPQMGNAPNIDQNNVTHHRQKPTYFYGQHANCCYVLIYTLILTLYARSYSHPRGIPWVSSGVGPTRPSTHREPKTAAVLRWLPPIRYADRDNKSHTCCNVTRGN